MVLDNFAIPMCHRVISGKVLISSQSILSAQSNKYIRKAATRMYNTVSMQLGEVEPEQFGRQAAKYWGVSHTAVSRSKFARPIPSNHVLETHKSFVWLTLTVVYGDKHSDEPLAVRVPYYSRIEKKTEKIKKTLKSTQCALFIMQLWQSREMAKSCPTMVYILCSILFLLVCCVCAFFHSRSSHQRRSMQFLSGLYWAGPGCVSNIMRLRKNKIFEAKKKPGMLSCCDRDASN